MPTAEQIAEYNAYLAFLRTYPGRNHPWPTSLEHYFENKDEWATRDYGEQPPDNGGDGGNGEEPTEEWTSAQRKAYERYKNYAALYKDPDDYYAPTINDYYGNYDVANEQLTEWETEASREYQQYRDLASHREPGDFYTTNQDDFVNNYDRAQRQQDVWMGRYTEYETRQQEVDEYYDWSRGRAYESAQEAYRPSPQYDPALYKQREALEGESVYYQNWMTDMFPELKRRFEATQPKQVGYPTREEQRAAEAQLEQGIGQYLTAEQEALRQEFYEQRPWDRGERPHIYQPKLRQLSYS